MNLLQLFHSYSFSLWRYPMFLPKEFKWKSMTLWWDLFLLNTCLITSHCAMLCWTDSKLEILSITQWFSRKRKNHVELYPNTFTFCFFPDSLKKLWCSNDFALNFTVKILTLKSSLKEACRCHQLPSTLQDLQKNTLYSVLIFFNIFTFSESHHKQILVFLFVCLFRDMWEK